MDDANHFSSFVPRTRLLAAGILNDNGPATNIKFNEGGIRRDCGMGLTPFA
jgi:hypothetical protein